MHENIHSRKKGFSIPTKIRIVVVVVIVGVVIVAIFVA